MSGGGRIPPAQNFWEGYTRSPEVTEKLVQTIKEALEAHPRQRLGQLIINSMSLTRQKQDLWNVWDEEMIELLQGYPIV